MKRLITLLLVSTLVLFCTPAMAEDSYESFQNLNWRMLAENEGRITLQNVPDLCEKVLRNNPELYPRGIAHKPNEFWMKHGMCVRSINAQLSPSVQSAEEARLAVLGRLIFLELFWYQQWQPFRRGLWGRIFCALLLIFLKRFDLNYLNQIQIFHLEVSVLYLIHLLIQIL